MPQKPQITKPGAVKKIIKSRFPDETEKAEIEVENADPLYKEIRIENSMEDQDGNRLKLKIGAHVSVTFDADIDQTAPANETK
jgi:hypothetical protein